MIDGGSSLPPGWAWAALGAVADIHLGKMLSPKAFAPGLVQLPYLRNENVQWRGVDITDVKTMGFHADEMERYGVQPGDLLVCEGGQPGRCAVFRGPDGRFMYQKALHRVRLLGGIPADLIRYCLEHYVRSGTGLPRTSETTIQHLPLEKMLTLRVPLPPLAEQNRIVTAIEEQVTRLDAAVKGLKRVQRQLKRYRAAVLKAACEGRLVPTEAELARAEDREYESADKLLGRILTERRARWEGEQIAKMQAAGKPPKDDAWKAKYAEPPAPTFSGLPARTEGWAWTTLRAIADLKGGITKGQKRRPSDVLREVPYLRVANVQRGYLDLRDIRTIAATAAEVEELRLEAGDILFNEGGDRDKLGRGWVWRGEIPECIHQNHVFRARPYTAETVSQFISWYGNTLGQQYFIDEGKQTTNLASINLTKLGALPVPLPPIAEQHRIVAEVERRLSVIEKSEAVVDANLKRATRLRQAVLRRAFEGKLVPQDPNDEPSSVLLERIRAERERAAGTAPKRRGAKAGKRTAANGQLPLVDDGIQAATGQDARAAASRYKQNGLS